MATIHTSCHAGSADARSRREGHNPAPWPLGGVADMDRPSVTGCSRARGRGRSTGDEAPGGREADATHHRRHRGSHRCSALPRGAVSISPSASSRVGRGRANHAQRLLSRPDPSRPVSGRPETARLARRLMDACGDGVPSHVDLRPYQLSWRPSTGTRSHGVSPMRSCSPTPSSGRDQPLRRLPRHLRRPHRRAPTPGCTPTRAASATSSGSTSRTGSSTTRSPTR